MLANIDNYPVDRILGEEDVIDFDQNSNVQDNETNAEQDKQSLAISTRDDFAALLKTLEQPPRSITSEEAATAPLYDVFINRYGPRTTDVDSACKCYS